MAAEPRAHRTVMKTIIVAWILTLNTIHCSTTIGRGSVRGVEGIPGILDDQPLGDEPMDTFTTSTPDTHEINCHFTLHSRSTVGGRCMSLGYQGIKTCVASIIYLDAGNADCMET